MKNQKTKIYFGIFSLCVMSAALFVPQVTYAAATMGLSPSSGGMTVGETKTTSVAINSGNQSINAAQATISFPADKLEVVGVSKGNIFTLWTKEPTYSNSAGTVSFAGGVPNPGFKGHGTMISITFRAKKSGTASLGISGAQALANDGKGTNIYGGAGGASYTIGAEASTAPASAAPTTEKPAEPEKEEEPENEEEEKNPPAAPAIASDTHPDQTTYFPNTEPRLTWTKEEGVTGFSYALDDQLSTLPKDEISGTENTFSFTNVPDGVWYFHVKALRDGIWGETSHYTIYVDTVPPKDLLVRLEGEMLRKDRNPIIHFSASDELSGLGGYTIFVDDTLVATLDAKATEITLETLSYGRHFIVVKAFDKAGNEAASQPLEVEIVKQYPGVGFTLGSLFISYALVTTMFILLLFILLLIIIIFGIWYFRHYCANNCGHTSVHLEPLPLPTRRSTRRQARAQTIPLRKPTKRRRSQLPPVDNTP